MGLSLTDYYKMTYGQYQAACEGYKFRLDRSENIQRQIAWIILKGYADPNDLPRDHKEFWPLSIDGIKAGKPARKRGKRLTEAQFRAFLERER
ncbi:hypothetical protein D3C87_964220 [compost metagenome]